jgi:hypothetical protein
MAFDDALKKLLATKPEKKGIKEKSYKLVQIEWVDSQGSSDGGRFLREEELKKTLADLLCKSVRWLVYDGKDCKRIIPHLSGDGDGLQGRGDLAIPSRTIAKITELKPCR